MLLMFYRRKRKQLNERRWLYLPCPHMRNNLLHSHLKWIRIKASFVFFFLPLKGSQSDKGGTFFIFDGWHSQVAIIFMTPGN